MQVAVIQPKTIFGDDAREQNLELAWKYARLAAQQCEQIACFPETFPGAWRMPVTWTPLADLEEIARETGIYLIGSFSEPWRTKPGTLRDWRRQAVFDANPAIITGNLDPIANRSAK